MSFQIAVTKTEYLNVIVLVIALKAIRGKSDISQVLEVDDVFSFAKR